MEEKEKEIRNAEMQNALQPHFEALVEWTKVNDRRVTFTVCAELTEEGALTAVALAGNPAKLTYALYKSTEINENLKDIVGGAGEAVKSPVGAAILSATALKGISGKSEGMLGDLMDILGDLLKKKS